VTENEFSGKCHNFFIIRDIPFKFGGYDWLIHFCDLGRSQMTLVTSRSRSKLWEIDKWQRSVLAFAIFTEEEPASANKKTKINSIV
jgi:hypothetical protein